MATLRGLISSCTITEDISIGTIIGVAIGSVTLLVIIVTVMIIMCKKKKRQPVLWLQHSTSDIATDCNQSIGMNYYPPYGQPSSEFNVPPPVNQQENIFTVSGEK